MRPGQQNKRGRGRNNGGNNNNNNNRKGQNPLSRTYDSSGPDVKIRGNAQTIADKYMSLARDAQGSGDRVMAENYLQHAEHYNRIIAAAQAQMQERFQRDDRDQSRDDQNDDSDGDSSNDDDSAQDGEVSGEQHHQQENRRRNGRERNRPGRESSDPDAPQPVIEGTPAEVALEQEDSNGQEGGKASSRRTRRPRRAKASDGDGTQGQDAEQTQPETAAAE